MADIIIFNEGNDDIIRHLRSADTNQYLGRTDVIIYADARASEIPALRNLFQTVRKDFLTKSGINVVEKSQAVKDAIVAAEAAAAIQSRRDSATGAVDGVDSQGVRVRALIELLNKRDNFDTNRIIELQNRVQAMLDSTGNLANMKSDGLAVSISATATRTKAEAVTDYKDDINAGNQDT